MPEGVLRLVADCEKRKKDKALCAQLSAFLITASVSTCFVSPCFGAPVPTKKPGASNVGAATKPGSQPNTSTAKVAAVWEKLIDSARYASLRNDDEQAQKDLQSAIANSEALKDDKALVACLEAQAEWLESHNQLSEALPVRQKAATLAEKAFGSQSPKLAGQLAGLASYYARKGENAQAWSHTERAMDILGKTGGGGTNPLEMASCSLATGRTQITERSFGLADDSFKKALELRESKLGPNSPLVLLTLKEYAALLEQLDRKGEAKKLIERITLANATAAASTTADTKPTTAATSSKKDKFLQHVEAAKNAYTVTKNLDDCKANWKLAVEAAEPTKGTRLAYALVHLSDMYMWAKQYPESEALLKRALQVREAAGSTDSLGAARNMERLASVSMMNKNYQEAEKLLSRAAEIEQREKASNNLQAHTLLTLASACLFTKNHGKGEQVSKQLMSVAEKIPGPTGANKKQLAASTLGSIYMQTGRMNEGMRLMQEAAGAAQTMKSPEEFIKASTEEIAAIEKEFDDSEEKTF